MNIVGSRASRRKKKKTLDSGGGFARFSTRPSVCIVVASRGKPPFHLVTRLEAGGNNSFSRGQPRPRARLSLSIFPRCLLFQTENSLFLLFLQETDCLASPRNHAVIYFSSALSVPRKALTSAAIFSLMRFSKSSTVEVVFIVAKSGIARTIYI